MSKIGKQPIHIPDGISVSVTPHEVSVSNARGAMSVKIPKGIRVEYSEHTVVVSSASAGKQARSNWGTIRALLQNAVSGLVRGFEKKLVLEGVGYRIAKEGEGLTLNLGFSHPVKYPAVPGITFDVEKNSGLTIRGTNKELVGRIAAEIRALKKPEPYKGKGFRYADEVIQRKAGKKAATASGTAA